jgi:hypothetical protein
VEYTQLVRQSPGVYPALHSTEFCKIDCAHSFEAGDCSEITLTEKSQFHTSTPLEIEHGSLMMGSKPEVHLTRETWCEYNEI